MINMIKYKDRRGKIQLPTFIVKNMLNYVELIGCDYCKFFDNNGAINIYLPNEIIITYYSTKDCANVYSRKRVIRKFQSWLNVLRYLQAIRNDKCFN